MCKQLGLSIEGHVAVIEMNRPPANAFELGFVNEFNRAIDEVTKNQTVRVIIITSGISKFFASGADIKLMFEMDNQRLQSELSRLLDKIQQLPKPVIAMINGHALGGGCELALCCDFRFMAKGTPKIGLPEVNLGILPAAGGTQRLSRLIGRGKATELLFEGSQMTAEGALQIGLIHKACNPQDLRTVSIEYANKLANQSPIAIGLIKKCLNEGVDGDLLKGLELEREALVLALQSEDAREGIKAYLEKRQPKFEGKKPGIISSKDDPV
jgi:enoyl-CoA hydratase/carnithine racemase